MTSASTREKLVEAAGPVFARHGYHAATVREIARHAGANVAAVNYHFGDKLGLYTEVLRQSIQAAKLEAINNALNRSGSPEEVLRGVIRARLQNVSGDQLSDWHFRIMVHELAQPTPALSRVVNEVSRPVYERLLQLIGLIIGLPPQNEKTRLCAHSVMGQILIYFLAAPLLIRLWPELKMTPEQVDRIAEHVADFSLAYLRRFRAGPGSAVAGNAGEKEDGGKTRD
jgi:AcrR family transcriptional regulator